ncbi:integrase, catalytic region, zinc finger, CCHC-type containing protein, partial [Tanacetum coccineum]
MDAEQAFWLRISNLTNKHSDASPVKIKAPKELPNVSLVNESLKKLKFHLSRFDNVVKIRTTPDARTKGKWGESMNMDGNRKESCNLEAELLKSQNAFNDLLKRHSQLEKHCISLECSIQLNQEIFQKQESCDNQNALEILEFFKNNDLKAHLQDKDSTICKLKDIIKSLREKSKEENVNYDYCELETKNVDMENKNENLKAQIQDKVFVITEAHINYLKYTQEQADILQGIVEQAKAAQPLDKELDFALPKRLLSHPKTMSRKLGLKCSTSKYESKPTGNKKNDKILQTPSRNIMNKVKAQPRKVNKKNRVVEPICHANVKHLKLNTNPDLNCATCKKSLFDDVHDKCLLDFVKNVVQIVLWYLDSGCSKHMTGNRSQLMNFVSKFLGTVRFGNDQIARIMGYGDYQLGNVVILRVYYVEGLGHNLFSVGQFCDADLEVAFWKNTCFIRNLEGVDLLSGSRDTNLYTISLDDMLRSSLICLLSKASKTKSWLWHRRLSHLNFGTLNKLAKDGLARGIPRLKFQKDHLCSACSLGKSKKSSHQPKAEDTNQEKLYLLHMDLCGPMRVASINGKRYWDFFGYTPVKKAFRIYNRSTWIITETIHVTFDELTAMASEQFSLGPRLQGMTPTTS